MGTWDSSSVFGNDAGCDAADALLRILRTVGPDLPDMFPEYEPDEGAPAGELPDLDVYLDEDIDEDVITWMAAVLRKPEAWTALRAEIDFAAYAIRPSDDVAYWAGLFSLLMNAGTTLPPDVEKAWKAFSALDFGELEDAEAGAEDDSSAPLVVWDSAS